MNHHDRREHLADIRALVALIVAKADQAMRAGAETALAETRRQLGEACAVLAGIGDEPHARAAYVEELLGRGRRHPVVRPDGCIVHVCDR